MRPLVISAITFLLVFGGALCAMYFRKVIAADHLREDVKDVVRLSTGIIGTIAALVLQCFVRARREASGKEESRSHKASHRPKGATTPLA